MVVQGENEVIHYPKRMVILGIQRWPVVANGIQNHLHRKTDPCFRLALPRLPAYEMRAMGCLYAMAKDRRQVWPC